MSGGKKMSDVHAVTTTLPAPGSKSKPSIRRKGRRGRGLRRPEEDVPSKDYVQKIDMLGPREGESYLSFKMRMAALRAGRELLLESARRNHGNIADVCRELGISNSNSAAHLKNTGLSSKDLHAFRPEYNR